MQDTKISTLLALALVSSPFAMSAEAPSRTNVNTISSGSTSHRASVRRMNHQLASAPLLKALTKPMGTYVGELQERWQFPSDHMPIAMSIEDLNFVSWNVLDSEYMDWQIEKNSQGLSRSQIADEHVYIEGSKLTIRDKHVVDLILEAISHPTHPRSILSLQETNAPFIEELRSRLPAQFEIFICHGDALVLDKNRFEVIKNDEVLGIFADSPHRAIQDVTIRRLDNGQHIRLLNVHLPGDPNQPARYEFAQYLAKTFDPSLTTMAMGDMNFNELEMADAMKKGFPQNNPFSIYSPYCTNISPNLLESKAIDHFIVYSPNGSPVRLNAPEEIMSGVAETVALLEGKQLQQAI